MSESSAPIRAAVSWDLENTSAPGRLTNAQAAANITEALQKSLGNPVIEFCGYGDTDQFSSKQNEEYEAGGIKVKDVPTKVREAADKSIILDMFQFALDEPPPACILLITQDKDFGRAVTTLSRMAYTMIVALKDSVSQSVVDAYKSHTIVSWNSLATGRGFTMHNSSNPICISLKQPQLKTPYRRGTGLVTAAFWDCKTCPYPQRIPPNKVADFIGNSLTSHPLIMTDGTIKPFNAYEDSRHVPQNVRDAWHNSGISFMNVQRDLKEDRLDKRILVEVLEFAWNNPAPCNIMLITGNSSLSPALCALKNRGYYVILATPTREGVTLLNNAGSILFAWPHQEEDISEASMWVKPGDVRGLKRNIVTLLNNHGGKIKLGDVASQYHALFGRPLVSREFNCRTIENLIRDLVEDAEIQGSGSNKIVHLKHTLRRVDVVTDDLRMFIESFSLGVPLSIFEALYGNEKSVAPLNQYFMSYGVKDVEGLCQANPDVAMLIKDKKTSTKRVMYTPVVKDRQKRLERDVIRLLEAYAGRTLFNCFEEYYKEMFRESIMYAYYGLTDLEHLCEVLKDTLEVTVEEVPVKSGGVCKLKQIHLLEYCQRYYSGGKE